MVTSPSHKKKKDLSLIKVCGKYGNKWKAPLNNLAYLHNKHFLTRI